MTGLTRAFVPGLSAGRTAGHLHTDVSKPPHEKTDFQQPGPLSQSWLVLGGKNGNHWIWDFKISFKDYFSEDSLCPSPLHLLEEISPDYSLERLMLKLQYFGHLMRRADSLEKTLMLRKTEGRRRRQ